MRRWLAIIMVFILCLFLTVPVNATSTGMDDDEGGDSTEETVIQTTEYPDDPTREPDLVSEAAIVMDATTGAILYEKNAYIPEYPASVTKIITCLLALENLSLSDTVTFSHDAVFSIERDSSNVGLDEGEVISVEDCLKAMMIESANEADNAIAEKTAGSFSAFAEMMNQKASELGCRGSHFANAHGLHDANHYTCAYDMALFLRAAMQYPAFRTMSSTINAEIPPTNLTAEVTPLWNSLKMIRPYSKYYYENIEGGKTGYTTVANCTLATYAKKGDMELICIVLNCGSRKNTYSDTRAIFEYCFNNYSYVYPLSDFSFSSAGADDNIVLSNFYKSASEDLLNLYVDRNFCLVLNNSIDASQISTNMTYSQGANTGILGQLEFSYQGELLGSTPITYKSYSALSTEVISSEGSGASTSQEGMSEGSTEAGTEQTGSSGEMVSTENGQNTGEKDQVNSDDKKKNKKTKKEKKKPGIFVRVLLTLAGIIIVLWLYLNVQRYRRRLSRRRRRNRRRRRR